MSQPSKYLDYLYYNIGGLYPIIQRKNRFYLKIQDDIIGVCYAEPMKIKGQTFVTF